MAASMNMSNIPEDFKEAFSQFCDAHAEKNINPVNAFLELSLFSQETKSKMAEFESITSSFRKDVVRLEELLKARDETMEKNFATIGEALQEKASAAEMEQLKDNAASVDAQMTTFDQALQEKAGAEDVATKLTTLDQALQASVEWSEGFEAAFQQHAGHTEEAAQKQNEHMENNFGSMRLQIECMNQGMEGKASVAQVECLTQAVQEKASAAQMDLVKEDMSTLQSGFATFGQALAEKSDTDYVESKLSELDAAIRAAAVRSEGLEATAAKRIGGVEETLKDKADISQVQTSIADIQSQVAGIAGFRKDVLLLEELIGQRVDLVNKSLAAVRGQVQSMGQSVQEKASTAETEQLKSNAATLQFQLETFGQALADKASVTLVDELKGNVMIVKSQVATVVDSFQETIQGNVKSSVESLSSQLGDFKIALKEKADVAQMNSNIADIQSQIVGIAGVGKDVAVLGDLMTKWDEHVESSLASMRGKVGDISQGLQEKASVAQVDQLLSTTTSLQTKVMSFDQSLQEKAENAHVQKLADSLTSLKKEELPEAAKVYQLKLDRIDQATKALSAKLGAESEAHQAMQTKMQTEKRDLATLTGVVQTSIADCKANMSNLFKHLNLKADVAAVPDLEQVALTLERKADAQIGAAAKNLESKLASSTDQLMNLAVAPLAPMRLPGCTMPGTPLPGTPTPGGLLQRQRRGKSCDSPSVAGTPGALPPRKRRAPASAFASFEEASSRRCPAPGTPGLLSFAAPARPGPAAPSTPSAPQRFATLATPLL